MFLKKKRLGIICFVCVIILMLFVLPQAFSQSSESLGDVNGDNSIDIIDALLVAQYYVQLPLSTFNPDVADVDATGSIDIVDALLIAQFYVGLITEFPGIRTGIEILKSEIDRNTDPQAETEELASVARGNNLFAFDLFHAIRANDEEGVNIFFSPLSISYTFAMCYAGANGNTETEIASVMHFTLPEDRLHNTFNALETILTREILEPPSYAGDELILHLVNSTWGQIGYPFVPGFLDTLAYNYGAAMNLVNFLLQPEECRLLINDWVSGETEQRIVDLLPRDSIKPETRLVLTNAIYFKANWITPFDESDTHDDLFYLLDGSTVTVPFMYQRLRTFYKEVPGEYKVVKIPYQGVKKYSMIIILPEQDQFEVFEEGFTFDTFSSIISPLYDYRVDITLPRFSYKWNDSLKTVLINLGMVDAFNLGIADFSGINDGVEALGIADVFHQAFIAVDEKGTEASAATAAVMAPPSLPDLVEITINRPFLYVIYNDNTDTIIFFGRVLTP